MQRVVIKIIMLKMLVNVFCMGEREMSSNTCFVWEKERCLRIGVILYENVSMLLVSGAQSNAQGPSTV